jgi:alanine racemase
MPRPTRARINLDALRHNHSIARRYAGSAHLWSVVKADAYGHGLLPAALGLQSVADGFALVEFEGAVELRAQGIRQPILMLEGIYQADDLNLCLDYALTPVLHDLWQIDALAAAALPTAIPVYLKLNTGMNRLGLSAVGLQHALRRLEAAGCVSSVTLMTHFADADDERGIAEQMARFASDTDGLNLPVSVANSAALLRFPESTAMADNWARPGIMLYGSSPFSHEQSALDLGLKPVMTLQSEIIAVQQLQAGDRVGYGGTFVATVPMRIGIVACGYADGYPRHAPTGTPVLVGGQRTRTLGRVSMDKLCVDLTGLEKVGPGATAILWGGDEKAYLAADEVATAAGTIAYELFCALAGRVSIEYAD